MACWKMSLVVMVMPEEVKAFKIPSTVCEICFITSTPSSCTLVVEGSQIHFQDVLEVALFTADSEPDIVLALHFPQLMLVKTDKELEP